MTEQLDRAYHSIMSTIMVDGRTPHYTDVAASLGVTPEDGRQLVHQLMELTPGWVHPGTDYIASFPPFNAQPTQYRVSVDGQERWYGQ